MATLNTLTQRLFDDWVEAEISFIVDMPSSEKSYKDTIRAKMLEYAQELGVVVKQQHKQEFNIKD